MIEQLIVLIFYLWPLLLLLVTYGTGKFMERAHYRDIKTRESATLGQAVITARALEEHRTVKQTDLAIGSVIVSVDYFKRFLGSFRNLFGGEVRSYASVVDRGKREALLRLKESCPDADIFVNCRLQTATLLNQHGRESGCVEVLAYATAVTYEK